ncbi:MAG: DUF3341 domain-containing protein [bacterium]|nr:DUF3341 domain-containing protein [bacterium]
MGDPRHGSLGAVLGFTLEYWVHVIEWPMNIGGKPLNSWPAFFPSCSKAEFWSAVFQLSSPCGPPANSRRRSP